MKNRTFIKTAVAVMLLAVVGNVSAKTWRVNNNATKGANFLSVNEAMSSSEVTPGDTLYIDPGTLLNQQTINKDSITVIGPGYFVSNMGLPYSTAVFTGDLIINSNHVKITGVQANVVLLNGYYTTIERCYLTNSLYHAKHPSAQRYHVIRQCYLSSGISSVYNGGYARSGGLTIENNIINGGVSYLTNSVIRNNTLLGTNNISQIENCHLENNILYGSSNITSNGNAFYKNVFKVAASSAYASIEATNKFIGSTDNTVLFKMTGFNDQQYQLCDDSPAKGYASDGGDCGAFGGATPYIISGMPLNHPYFTQINVASRSKDGKIKVSLNTKMQND